MMIAGIGTVAVALVARWGLRSLALSKQDMQIRAQRDARECAIARFEELARDIIPANAHLWATIAASKVDPLVVESPAEVKFDPDDSEHIAEAMKIREKLPSDVRKDITFFLNQLEAWAAYHTQGLADHEISLRPCAPVFCSFVVQHYAILLTTRVNTAAGSYPNVVELFKSWRADLEGQQLSLREEDLRSQQKALETARNKNRSTLQPPLGFDP